MNEEVFNDVVIRYDLKAARIDCLDAFQDVLSKLGAAIKRIDALTADDADDVMRRLLRMEIDASWLAKTLNKENEE